MRRSNPKVARRRRLTDRFGLLARFSVLSLIALVALGVVLAQTLSSQIRSRALTTSAQAADLVTRFGILPQLASVDLSGGLSPEAVTSLDGLLRAGYTSQQVETIRIWGADHRIIYSPDHSLIGMSSGSLPALDKALGGATVAELQSGGGDRTDAKGGPATIEAFVPLRLTPTGPPAGAFEVHLRYAPIAQAISRDTDRLYVALAIGFVILYAALFRIVAGASSRLRRQATENEYQARHDMLTGLPNRTSFYEAVTAAIEARGDGDALAVMIVDLDRFKEVNDTLGHHSGDLLLQQAATRLRSTLRGDDALARLGGDEFAIVLTQLPTAERAGDVAKRIAEVLEQPFLLDGLTVHIEASVGIALCPDHGVDVETLMRRADVAMYVAKGSSAGHETYAATRDEHSADRLALLGELRHALDAGEFVLHYQPKANLRTGRVEGAEALVRWEHPRRGMVAPTEFIPLAEHTGLIKPLTTWVLDSALEQCGRWCADGLDLKVAVNLSVRNLLDAHLPESIASLLRKWELPPSRLQLEITEGAIIADQVRALDVLSRLDSMGVGLAIDDFGTGYSSLAYLKDLPVGELKIDRTFVNNMTEDGSDAFIVRSTIDLGRNLGLEVVAEGVETEATWTHLRSLGCDIAQGYYLSRPVPADRFEEWLTARGEGNPAAAAPLVGNRADAGEPGVFS